MTVTSPSCRSPQTKRRHLLTSSQTLTLSAHLSVNIQKSDEWILQTAEPGLSLQSRAKVKLYPLLPTYIFNLKIKCPAVGKAAAISYQTQRRYAKPYKHRRRLKRIQMLLPFQQQRPELLPPHEVTVELSPALNLAADWLLLFGLRQHVETEERDTSIPVTRGDRSSTPRLLIKMGQCSQSSSLAPSQCQTGKTPSVS